MKRLMIFFIAILGCMNLVAQKQADIMLMAAFQTKDNEITASAKELLLKKIREEINREGFSGVSGSRFIVMANPQIIDKQQNGQLLMYTYEIQFTVTDLVADKTYSSFTARAGGVGRNGGQASMDAFRRLNLKKTDMARNIGESVRQIVEYYNANCTSILARTNIYLEAKQYEAAMANLAFIPDMHNLSCGREYNDMLLKAYTQYNAYKCEMALTEARKEWALNPTIHGAGNISRILSGIQLNAACREEFNTLTSQIGKKLVQDQFDEKEFIRKIYESEVALERDLIHASRDIAVEYYRNSRPDVYLLVH